MVPTLRTQHGIGNWHCCKDNEDARNVKVDMVEWLKGWHIYQAIDNVPHGWSMTHVETSHRFRPILRCQG